MSLPPAVKIREVGPRDGFQNEPEVLATADLPGRTDVGPGAFGVTARAYDAAIRLIESGSVPLERMHTHDFPLADAERAIQMLAGAQSRKQLEDDIRTALSEGAFHLVYQPVVSTADTRIVGYEALLRWDHPERGTLLPAQFLHLAEESGSIVPIGDWVTRQACLDTRAWLDAGLVDRSFSVHINVAARQLAEGTFVERVLATVQNGDSGDDAAGRTAGGQNCATTCADGGIAVACGVRPASEEEGFHVRDL